MVLNLTNLAHRCRQRAPLPWQENDKLCRHSGGGFIAPLVIDRPINCFSFETYVDKVPLPELHAGNVVVMEISPATKNSGFAK